MPVAFTRAVSPRLAECALTHLERRPIDPAKAAAQHSAYENVLRDCGFEIVRLPDLPTHPDGVFVEDTALLLGRHAVITRPGVKSRASETQSTAAGLGRHFELHHIAAGFVDGGDVLRIGRTLFAGLSTRTNLEGIEALRKTVAPLGFDVHQAILRDCLHLKTAATFAGTDASGSPVLLYYPPAVDPEQFAGVMAVAVDDGEPAAANCLRAGRTLVLSEGNPATAAMLRTRGFELVELDVSELQKAEAGVTCMSLIADD